MTIGKILISKEIGRLKRGVAYAKKSIANAGGKSDTTGWRKTVDLNEKDIKELEKDMKKL